MKTNRARASQRRLQSGAITECLEPRQFLSATSLDTSFNNTGKVYSSLGTFMAVANLPDGKVLAAGFTPDTGPQNFLVARYNANGSVDTSFGGGTGRVFTDFSGRIDQGMAIALQTDGKFLVAGQSQSTSNGQDLNFAIARYNSNGTLDSTFGTSGKTQIDFSGRYDSFGAIAILSNGKIMMVGRTISSSVDAIALARLNTDGKLDTSFGGGTGRKTASLGTTTINGQTFVRFVEPHAMTVLPSGEFLVAGSLRTANEGTTFESAAVALFRTDGTFDKTNFGAGKGWTEATGMTDVASIAELASGKFLIGGTNDLSTELHADSRFSLARFNANGSLDTAFGTQHGYTQTSMRVSTDAFASISNRVGGIAVQPNGKILAAGSVEDSGDQQPGGNPGGAFLGLIRYNSNGTLDTSFSGDGKFFSTGTLDQVTGIARGLGGKNIVVGTFGKAGILRFGADSPATAAISGFFYGDTNGNGIKDAGDSILAGWRAFIDANNNGYFDFGEISAVSNSQGFYALTGLAPGTYRVREVRQDGWTRTQPAGAYPLGYYDVTVTAGHTVSGRNFGNKHA